MKLSLSCLHKLASSCLLAAALATPAAAHHGTMFGPPEGVTETIQVTTELVMLIDSSGSIDDEEYQLQREGYVLAFRDSEVQDLIERQDGVAVWAYDFSAVDQTALLAHRILKTAADCDAFADELEAPERQFASGTVIAMPLLKAAVMLTTNHIESKRTVIDISGDGVCEFTRKRRMRKFYKHRTDLPKSLAEIRDSLPDSITVNAIAIGTPLKRDNHSLAEWYKANLPHGRDAFSLYSNGFVAFRQGIKHKILLELEAPLTPLFD